MGFSKGFGKVAGGVVGDTVKIIGEATNTAQGGGYLKSNPDGILSNNLDN
jgi:Protein of unknown function (DUF3892)